MNHSAVAKNQQTNNGKSALALNNSLNRMDCTSVRQLLYPNIRLTMVNGHGRGKRDRGRGGNFTTQAPKKMRVPSDKQEDSEVEVDPEVLLDFLLTCLTKK